MKFISWFFIDRWTFKRQAKRFGTSYPGCGTEIYVAALRNNLAGCRDNKYIAKDMFNILNKYN
ncbi:hypothetical protein A71_48 [Escherichia phage A7_1]|nr:hypothetical protein A71_48 [Escherichia phage A7_1]